jgi:hypothetical protein
VKSPRHRFRKSTAIRWIRVSLAVLVLCGLGAIAWRVVDHGGLADRIKVLAAARASFVSAGPEESASAPVAAKAPNGESDPGLVEVCGLGWVEKKDDSPFLDPALFAQIPGIETSLETIVDALRRSPDAFSRAAASVLEMYPASGAASDQAALESLAREATTSDDPRLYALAFRLCGRTPAAGSCALLSAEQWARVDAGNGEPWLFVLDDAAARGDRAMLDEALYRIGSAGRFEDRFHALAGPIVALAGASPPDLMAAQLLTTKVIGVTAALPLSLQRLTNACRGAALADANRRQVCDAVAATLGERSDSMLMANIGASIGRRIGWPLERIVAVRALSVALADSWAAVPGADPVQGASYSCDGVRSTIARLAQLARIGEPQAARDWIAASGKTYESFARVAGEQEARRTAAAAEDSQRRNVAAAASAASGPRTGG